MIQIRRSAIVRHSCTRMFDLVNDVAAYPERFAWCDGSEVLEQSVRHMLARLDLRIGGLPVPKPLIQQVLSYYSKTTSHPQGVRLDDPFELPANIQKIEVGQAQAVVVQ